MKDTNTCPHCCQRNPVAQTDCGFCNQQIVFAPTGSVSIWRLGTIREGLVGILARAISDTLAVPCVIQPAYIDERPSLRPNWKGISSNVFLRQTLGRSSNREVAALGITEKNIVPSARYNFLFGYAYVGLPAATVSLYPMVADDPPEWVLAERLAKIALHELGHTFGLGHHSYEDEEDCLMVGDETIDSTATIDSGQIKFCDACARVIKRNVRLRKRCSL